MKCGDCKFFERDKWHKSICEDESDQLGGQCKVLHEILSMTNHWYLDTKSLHVYEGFGCVAHRTKE